MALSLEVKSPGNYRSSEGRNGIDAGLFTPYAVRKNKWFGVQIILHPDGPEFAARALRLSRQLDPTAQEHDRSLLDARIERGDRIYARFVSDTIDVDITEKTALWRKDITRIVFRAKTDAEHGSGQVRLYFEGMIVGELNFGVTTNEKPTGQDGQHVTLKRYRKVFLSYTKSDRLQVLRHNQLIRRLGMDVFQDVTSIEPGEDWREALYRELKNADLLLVYWSKAASNSKWVTKEVQRAMELRAERNGAGPEICPVLLEGPPPAKPPSAIACLHFDDPMNYIIYAHEALAEENARPD
ncbi:MAG: toll/interleukin-1 receptor domain-containing protein [Paracoccaceae bacterium]